MRRSRPTSSISLTLSASSQWQRGSSPKGSWILCRTSAAISVRGTCSPGRCRRIRSEEHTSELQSRGHLVCRLLLEKKKEEQTSELQSRGQHVCRLRLGKKLYLHEELCYND